MAWIPAHQSLRRHPKLRKAAAALEIGRPHMLGHLIHLWWWAVDYAPDGDLSRFDPEDIAEGAGWDEDPMAFVDALRSAGWLDDLQLHDWDEYYGKYEGRKADGQRGNHIRWHENRGVIDPDCALCSPEAGPESAVDRGDIGGRSGGESQIRGDKRRGEETGEPAQGRRVTAAPASLTPNSKHEELAKDAGVDVLVEAEHFLDFHRAKGSKFKDWDAAFRTWLRNAKKFRPTPLRAVGDDVGGVRYT